MTHKNGNIQGNRGLNLGFLSGTNWGCKPKKSMQLYKQFVRPILEYGAIALLSAPKATLENIQLVLYKAINIAYRLPWCTSTHMSRLAASGLSDLDNRCALKLYEQEGCEHYEYSL